MNWQRRRIENFVEQKARRMEELERDGSMLFPGAQTAIRGSAAALPIAIASGALGAEIRRVLDRANLTHHFTAIVSAEDTPASKPAPDPYLRAVALLTQSRGPLEAGECLAVEDSRWGLESARAAGLKTMAVEHSYAARELGPADVIIPSLEAFDLAALQQRFSAGAV
jgi:HAD superfamily hydrolase (TIGR01509 family)